MNRREQHAGSAGVPAGKSALSAGRQGCRRLATTFCILHSAFCILPSLHAHDPGLSALAMRVGPERITAELSLAKADVEAMVWLDENLDGRVSPQEFEVARPKLESLALDALELRLDGHSLVGTNTAQELDSSDAVHLRLAFARVPATNATLQLDAALLATLPRGHKQYASVRDTAGALLGEWMLDASSRTFAITNVPGAAPADSPTTAPAASTQTAATHSFWEFLKLGVEHIALGFDHLVFLLGLLVVGARFGIVVRIITAFTIAHSITLALATFDLIRIPPRIVEPLIAASIVYVGVENLVTRKLDRRWLLAFGFGLIHGCGFASVLRDLGVGTGPGVAVPLLAFNLGVELGQVTLAALVLPIIWKLKPRAFFQPRFVPVVSGLIVLAGGYWLFERLFS